MPTRLLLHERNVDARKVQVPVLLSRRHVRAPQLRRRVPAPQHIRLWHPGHFGEIVHAVPGRKLQKFFRREQVPALPARLLLPARHGQLPGVPVPHRQLLPAGWRHAERRGDRLPHPVSVRNVRVGDGVRVVRVRGVPAGNVQQPGGPASVPAVREQRHQRTGSFRVRVRRKQQGFPAERRRVRVQVGVRLLRRGFRASVGRKL